MDMGQTEETERRPMPLFLQPLWMLYQFYGGTDGRDRTPPHVSVPVTIIVTEPVGWTTEGTERCPVSPCLMPLQQLNRLDGHGRRKKQNAAPCPST
ncbi:hypothetical protein AVEN_197199-1 [Araneus ventricosus]|uniref:Uncharacterized protein n=1 Tax=Araneus ventricosus TaxID=182803 RepID=A0A4Y2PMM0_ARAVE|nr:hypothetical protein AVEN_197199-1 [Araneus ventricosus]